jgi:hypothetical protein
VTQQSGSEESFDQQDVDAFVHKFEAWARGLDASDRALLQLVLQPGEGERIDTSFNVEGGIGSVVEPFLRERVQGLTLRLPGGGKRPQRPRAWVEAGEPWIQYG